MSVLDLICPARCEGCGGPGGPACRRCRLALAAPARPHRPDPCPAGFPVTWVVATYDATTRGLLLGFKERGAAALAVVLASALATAVRAVCPPDVQPLLVPVPSSRSAVRSRGDDVVSLLASRTARLLRRDRLECRFASVLTQLRPVADSAGLSAGHRAANLCGALGVRPGRARLVEGARIVIVDDLVTTGATLSEARRALEGAGAEVIGAVAVAATSRRFRPGAAAKS